MTENGPIHLDVGTTHYLRRLNTSALLSPFRHLLYPIEPMLNR